VLIPGAHMIEHLGINRAQSWLRWDLCELRFAGGIDILRHYAVHAGNYRFAKDNEQRSSSNARRPMTRSW
jgi:hypothetical protein